MASSVVYFKVQNEGPEVELYAARPLAVDARLRLFAGYFLEGRTRTSKNFCLFSNKKDNNRSLLEFLEWIPSDVNGLPLHAKERVTESIPL